MSAAPDTIAAIATAPGRAAIGIIRISGSGALEVLKGVFSPRTPGSWSCGKIRRGDFLGSDGRPLDNGLAFFMANPRSYTGEDYAELQCHGNPLILEKLLESLQIRGARAARPGEFTRRAFLNGKMDLSQCEGVDELIRSQSASSCLAAWRLQEGGLRKLLEPLALEAKTLLAKIQGAIEFADDVKEDLEDYEAKFSHIAGEIQKLLRTAPLASKLKDGLRVAICGRPNAGKSSLFNALLGEDRAMVASLAGTTRDTLSGELELKGYLVTLFDTAGLRNARGRLEAMGVSRSQDTMEKSDLLLWVFDGHRRQTSKEKAEMQEWTGKRPLICLRSRLDLGARPEKGEIGFSSVSGEGLDEIRSALAGHCQKAFAGAENVIALRARHADLLKVAGEAAQRGLEGLKMGAYSELLAADAQEILDSLGEVTGTVGREEILDAIFKEFCIGK